MYAKAGRSRPSVPRRGWIAAWKRQLETCTPHPIISPEPPTVTRFRTPFYPFADVRVSMLSDELCIIACRHGSCRRTASRMELNVVSESFLSLCSMGLARLLPDSLQNFCAELSYNISLCARHGPLPKLGLLVAGLETFDPVASHYWLTISLMGTRLARSGDGERQYT